MNSATEQDSLDHHGTTDIKKGQAGQKLLRFLGYLPALIIFPILFFTLYNHLSRLPVKDIDFEVWPLIFSAFLLILHFTLTGLGWWLLLYFLRARIPVYQAVRISAISLLGRYIPGKVWTILGKVYLGEKMGLSKKVAFAASAYEFFFFNISGLLVFLMVDILDSGKLPSFPALYIILPIFTGLTFAFPNLIVFILNIALRLVNKNPIDARLNYIHVLCSFLYYSGLWFVTALSFHFFIRAIFRDISFPLLTGALVLANVAAFIVLIAPAGLGVREGVLAYVLSMAQIPPAQAVLIALASRVWSTAGELMVVTPVYFYRGKKSLHRELSGDVEDACP